MTGEICHLIMCKRDRADLQCHHRVYFSMSAGIPPNFSSILLLEITSVTFHLKVDYCSVDDYSVQKVFLPVFA